MKEQMSSSSPEGTYKIPTQRLTIAGLPAPEAFSDKTITATFDVPTVGETTGEFNKIIEEGYKAPDADVSADPAERFPKEDELEAAPVVMTRAEAKKTSYSGRREHTDEHIGRHRSGFHTDKEDYKLSATVSEYIRSSQNAAAKVLGALAAAKAAILPKSAGYIGRHSTEGLFLAERAQRLADEAAEEAATPDQMGTADGDTLDADKLVDATNTTDDEAEQAPRSLTQRLRDTQLKGISYLTAKSQQRHEKWAEMSKGEHSEIRRNRIIGGAVLAMIGVGATVVARHYGMESSGGGAGSTAATAADFLHGTDSTDHLPTVTEIQSKDGGDHLPLITDADLDAIPKDALKFKEGNGVFHVFNKMGIPSDKWHEVLGEVGPKLVDAGEAYPDKSIGGYGLVNDGKLTRSAARIIKSAKALK